VLSYHTETKGLNETIQSLVDLPFVIQNELYRATDETMNQFVRLVKIYPPESDANKPRTNPPYWYVRGVGIHFADGSVEYTSEQLGDSWGHETRIMGVYDVEGQASTDVTYAPYVQSDALQAAFHAARDWKTVETILQEMDIGAVGGVIDVFTTSGRRSYFVDATNRIAQYLERG
jgi:hypothetical protein